MVSEETIFTWTPKLTRLIDEMSNDYTPGQCFEFIYGVINYGTRGIEPNFDDVGMKHSSADKVEPSAVMKALFVLIRDDIDESRRKL